MPGSPSPHLPPTTPCTRLVCCTRPCCFFLPPQDNIKEAELLEYIDKEVLPLPLYDQDAGRVRPQAQMPAQPQ